MKLLRITDVNLMLEAIGPHLLPDTDYPVEILREQLAAMLTAMPENIFILAAVENSRVLGFMIVTAEPHVPHAYISQAWSDPKGPPYTTRKLFQRVVVWAEEMGKTEIRMETKRDPRGFTRRYAFSPFSTIMQYIIPPDSILQEVPGGELPAEPRVLDLPQEDRPDVQEKQNIIRELHSGDHQGADSGGEPAGTEDRQRSDSLRPAAESGGSTPGDASAASKPLGGPAHHTVELAGGGSSEWAKRKGIV